ncbi:MAG: hypothetical protein Q9195_009161 [Heterodermia aff. obscurata]
MLSVRIVLSLAFLFSTATAACYYQNGTDVTKFNPANKSYQPCNVTAQASMCCRINLDAGSPKDHCRPDGLCDSPNHEFLWRESCSDPTWKSPHCQKLCLNYDGPSPWGFSVAGIDVELTACDDGSLCCGIGTNGSTCCTEGKGVWIVNGKETTVNPNKTASASASAIPASTSATSTTSATPGPSIATESSEASISSKSHTGAIAGGVIGGVVGLGLIAGAMYWLFRPRRTGDMESSTSKRRGFATELDSGAEKTQRHEMPNMQFPYEADGIPRGELDGGGKRM